MKKYENTNLISINYIKYFNSLEWENKICNDEMIGYVEISSSGIKFTRRKDYDDTFVNIKDIAKYLENESKEVAGKIALIIESPHIKEFILECVKDFSTKKAINSRPANGQTGVNLDNYFDEIFEDELKKIKPGLYSLSLLNSIQNQCSLGTDPKLYRDRIWSICWFKLNRYNNDSINRLTDFDPDIILNCATIGEHYRILEDGTNYDTQKKALKFTKKFLKDEFGIKYSNKATIQKIITDAIRNSKSLKNIKLLHSTHPSSWHSGENRIIKTL